MTNERTIEAGNLPEVTSPTDSTLLLTTTGKVSVEKIGRVALNHIVAHGVCSTAAGTQAKTVAVSGFLALTGAIVSVRFQQGITCDNATLAVGSTAAKPIRMNGVALPAKAVGTNATVTMQYDGTAWQVLAVTSGVSTSDELLVDMGLPSGILWATRNIDVTQANGFAASPFQYECSFVSWGNTEMHNPISASEFEYNFGSENDGPYADTHGATLTGDFGLGDDAAHVNLGNAWRMPKTAEFAELFNATYTEYIDAAGVAYGESGFACASSNSADRRVVVNGVTGLYLRSKVNGKKLFFACSGNGYGASWYNRGSYGFYWSASLSSQTHGRYLYFHSGGVNPQHALSRFDGFAVRPVQ